VNCGLGDTRRRAAHAVLGDHRYNHRCALFLGSVPHKQTSLTAFSRSYAPQTVHHSGYVEGHKDLVCESELSVGTRLLLDGLLNLRWHWVRHQPSAHPSRLRNHLNCADRDVYRPARNNIRNVNRHHPRQDQQVQTNIESDLRRKSPDNTLFCLLPLTSRK
jgi:hypothetical protein